MGKENNGDASKDAADLLEKARSELADIVSIKEAAFKALGEAESARKAADDHASYANKAKISTEEHSKAVATFKGQIESDLATITVNKQKADEQTAALSAAKGNVDAELIVITNQKRDAEASAEEIRKAATLGKGLIQEVEQNKTTITSYQKTALDLQTKITELASSADGSANTIQSLQSKADESAKTITTNLSSSTANAQALTKLLADSTNEKNEITKIIEILKKSEEKSSAYEEKLKELETVFQQLKNQIEGLLAGATSVGLASAFKTQKERFGKPQGRWLWTFIVCIGLLFIISVPTFLRAAFPAWLPATLGNPPTNWGEIFMGFAMRLPVFAPLVWLAIYAGRNYMLSLRMEEDYAYKETISRAFEGYKREMKEVADTNPESATLLATFCDNVLRALAERPGRIYDGKHDDITPLNEAAKLAHKSINTAP